MQSLNKTCRNPRRNHPPVRVPSHAVFLFLLATHLPQKFPLRNTLASCSSSDCCLGLHSCWALPPSHPSTCSSFSFLTLHINNRKTKGIFAATSWKCLAFMKAGKFNSSPKVAVKWILWLNITNRRHTHTHDNKMLFLPQSLSSNKGRLIVYKTNHLILHPWVAFQLWEAISF